MYLFGMHIGIYFSAHLISSLCSVNQIFHDLLKLWKGICENPVAEPALSTCLKENFPE